MVFRTRCKTCAHPRVREINEVFEGQQISLKGIRDYYAPDLTLSSLQYHFAHNHHLREPDTFLTPTDPEDLQNIVTVHWQMPRSLMKQLRHEAIDRELSTVELVRRYIRHGLDNLKP